MDLKTWLSGERGRSRDLAKWLGVDKTRVSQMARLGVPVAHIDRVAKFTNHEVSAAEMMAAVVERGRRASRAAQAAACARSKRTRARRRVAA